MAITVTTSPATVSAPGTAYFDVKNNATMALIQISGTYTTVAFTIQGCIDGTNVFPIAAFAENDQVVVAGTTSISPTDSTVRTWLVPCAGFASVGVNVTAIATGSLVVTCTSNAYVGSPIVATTNTNNTTSGNQAFTGTLTVTSTSASALTVGANGATNPSLKINANTASAATGLTIISAAAAGGVALTVISSGTDESMVVNAKGTGTITLNNTATGNLIIGTNTTIADAKNIVLNTTSGTSIGTATTQKLSFYGKTPVVQPVANTTDVSTTAAGSTTTVFLNTTFPGTGGTAAYTVSAVVTALKALGLLAP